MWKSIVFAAAGLGAGFAAAAWLASGAPPPVGLVPAPGRHDAPEGGVSDPRVESLGAALEAEKAAREALQTRVEQLADQLQALQDKPTDAAAGAHGDGGRTDTPGPRGFRGFAGGREELQQREQEALAAAGFAPDRAEWIAHRASELRMQALQARYDAARGGKPLNAAADSPEQTLRNELGDADYERYLQALNRPTTVAVRDVLASSPAEKAGLKPGDQVVAYDGQRVFDARDLNALTLKGNAGEPVVLEVQRDGQHLQIVMPRGPVGILSGGRFGPRP